MRRWLSQPGEEGEPDDPEIWRPYVEPRTDLVVPSRVDPAGVTGPTRGRAAGPKWRQTSPGLYVPIEADADVVEQRILEQAGRLREWGAVTGWAALRWRGAAYFNGLGPDRSLLPVPLVTGRQWLRPDARVEISSAQLAPGERLCTRGIPVTTVQRALFDVMRGESSLRSAVVAMDMAAAAGLISVALMRSYVLQRNAWTGVPLTRRALQFASDDSASPQESLMRLVWVLDAGLPEPMCNQPVFSHDGRLLGYPDLFDAEGGVAVEYEGSHHRRAEQRRRDVERETRFRDHGLEVMSVVEGDLRRRHAVAQRMHDARERARRSRAPQHWTIEPPAGWMPFRESLDTHLLRTGQAAELVRCSLPASWDEVWPDHGYPHTDDILAG